MISLCMIVRDEATLLPDFLQAIKGLCDELCVADTGSTDQTISLLEQAGAKIIHFPWCNDFAAARNASLSLASGDWIIYLDPDETPSPALIAEIRKLEQDTRAGAASILMRNQYSDGKVKEQRLIRVFRRRPEIRFEHAIHEDASRTIGEMLRAEHLEIRHLAGPVEHIGYQSHWMQARNKRQRDQKILENCLGQNPDDLYSAYKLLELANYWQDHALANAACEHLLAALARSPIEVLSEQRWGADLLARLARTRFPNTPEAALTLLASHPVPLSLDFLETRGLFKESHGQVTEAREDFEAALRLCDTEHYPSEMRITAMLGLARLALGQGDLASGEAWIHAALTINPRNLLALRYALLIANLTGGRTGLIQACHRLAVHFNIAQELAELGPEFGLTASDLSGFAS